jgi:hypothetical protein
LIADQEEIIFEKQDNFQKQTYRNRCYIYGANGRQLLSVPIQHSKSNQRQKTKDIKIDHAFAWKKNIKKSLESSYRSSPYFEFYEDEIMQIFEKPHNFLLDLNMHSYELINDCLQLDQKFSFTEDYVHTDIETNDYRFLVNAKKMPAYDLNSYTQVFDDKHGFISNLSILDLLFNEGTNAPDYLTSHSNLIIDKF